MFKKTMIRVALAATALLCLVALSSLGAADDADALITPRLTGSSAPAFEPTNEVSGVERFFDLTPAAVGPVHMPPDIADGQVEALNGAAGAATHRAR